MINLFLGLLALVVLGLGALLWRTKRNFFPIKKEYQTRALDFSHNYGKFLCFCGLLLICLIFLNSPLFISIGVVIASFAAVIYIFLMLRWM